MEEQADTDKTDTEWTDKEMEHASYTLHAMLVQSEASMSTTFNDVSLLDRSMYYWVPAVWTPVL